MDGDARTETLVGRVLHQTYRLERLLGQGGMGSVFEASHARLRRRFAVKVLNPEVAGEQESVARFRREAEVTSELGHPHIVEVVDFNFTDEGWPYLVMELLQGKDLAVLLHGTVLSPQRAVTIFGQAASALEAAHDRGIIHRDLKPSNLFLCDRPDGADYVKVVDFGISKVVGATSAMTRTQTTMGTPAYMAPEQAEGRSAAADARTDVFAMAVILYEMVAGRPPFFGESIPSVLYQVVHQEAVSLITFRPGLPRALDEAVARGLSKRPEDRFPSMTLFARAVQEALAGAPAEPAVATAPTITPAMTAADRATGQPEPGQAPGLAPTLPPAAASAATPPDASTATPAGAAAAGPVAAGPVAQQAPPAAHLQSTLSASAGEVRGVEAAPIARPHRRLPWIVAGAAGLAGAVALLALRGTEQAPPEPVAAVHPAAVADARPGASPDAAVLHQIEVTAPRHVGQMRCQLAIDGQKEAEVLPPGPPCRFSVPKGKVVDLEVEQLAPKRVWTKRWRVREDRAFELRVFGGELWDAQEWRASRRPAAWPVGVGGQGPRIVVTSKRGYRLRCQLALGDDDQRPEVVAGQVCELPVELGQQVGLEVRELTEEGQDKDEGPVWEDSWRVDGSRVVDVRISGRRIWDGNKSSKRPSAHRAPARDGTAKSLTTPATDRRSKARTPAKKPAPKARDRRSSPGDDWL